jgi:hypothetical protein
MSANVVLPTAPVAAAADPEAPASPGDSLASCGVADARLPPEQALGHLSDDAPATGNGPTGVPLLSTLVAKPQQPSTQARPARARERGREREAPAAVSHA